MRTSLLRRGHPHQSCQLLLEVRMCCEARSRKIAVQSKVPKNQRLRVVHLVSPHDPRSLFAGLYSLEGTVQEVRNAKRFGAATEIVVIERLALDEENAKHITPLSI